MSIYRFEQFNVDLTDPTMELVKATYAIGETLGSVEVVLATADARLYGVVFEGFPNGDDWGDDDVIAWAESELEKHKVDA